jgi:hypothetical protein
MPSDHAGAESGSHGLSSSLRRNIEALRERRNQKTISASPEERLANAITAFTGSMRFVYLHLAIYGSWIILRRSDFEGSQSACHFVRRTSGFLSHRFDRSVCRLLGLCPTFALGAKFLEF